MKISTLSLSLSVSVCVNSVSLREFVSDFGEICVVAKIVCATHIVIFFKWFLEEEGAGDRGGCCGWLLLLLVVFYEECTCIVLGVWS